MNEEKLDQEKSNLTDISHKDKLINKKILLELLEDEEVKEKINNSLIDRLKAILAKWLNFDQDSSHLKVEIEQLKKKLGDVENEKEKLKKTYTEQIDQMKNEIVEFKKNTNAYERVKKLSTSTKKSLENIIKEDSLASFIASGVQSRNIENLWDYINNELKEGQNVDTKELIEIFYFLFANFAKANGDIYKLQAISIGDEFDPQLHLRHNSSKGVSGKINEILLKGMMNSKTQEIKRKTVVKI